MKKALPLLSAAILLLTAGCDDSSAPASSPKTPEEMYAMSRELLMPGPEREAPDYAGSLQWLRQAAEAGWLQAQLDLAGLYYEGGKGVERNPAESLKWFTRAQMQGNAQACVFMGLLYSNGKGVPADPAKAVFYWRKASEAGVAEADFYLGDALLQKPETVAVAVEHLKKAATHIQGGLAARAAAMLASLYWHGHGPLQPDRESAIMWYRHAAEAGDAQSQYIYGMMLLDGGYVPKDAEAGMACLRMAAGQDHMEAMALLITLLRDAEAPTPDTQAEADAWRQRFDALNAASGEGVGN